MTTACVENFYFSGQGAVLASPKDPVTGNPTGFTPVGNLASLSIGIQANIVDHKETCTGSRAIDKQLTTQILGQVKLAMESIFKENLAFAAFGTAETVDADDVVNEAIESVQQGKWYGLEHIKVSTVVVADATGTNATSGYKVVNVGGAKVAGSASGLANNATVFSATILVDGTHSRLVQVIGSEAQTYGTLITQINQDLGGFAVAAIVGGNVRVTSVLTGTSSTVAFTDVDLFSSLTGYVALLAAVAGTNGTPGALYDLTDDYLLNADAGSIFVVDGGAIPSDSDIQVDYHFAKQDWVQGITHAFGDEVWLRFEGLNTVEENKPVVVDIFRFQFAPLAELALINDNFAQMAVEGRALVDNTRATGSKIFRFRYIGIDD